MARRDSRGSLPREERLALRRCEVDRERGFATTRHTGPFQEGEYGSFGHVPEKVSFVSSFQGHHNSI
jgi:hypothetical protein